MIQHIKSGIKSLLSHYKIFFTITMCALSITGALILPSACVKEYINGDLDGMWRVDKITLSDGQELNMSEAEYISFQFHVVQLSRYDAVVAWGNLHYDGETVRLDFPNNSSEDKLKTLNQWGIYSSDVTYRIVKLTKDRLIMTSPESTMECTHF